MSRMMSGRKDDILRAAARLLTDGGLTNWSIEGCSREARCAKGLVLHYFKTKEQLLGAVAATLSSARWAEWSSSLASGGIAGLDQLWDHLRAEVENGRARALLELRLAQVADAALAPAEATELRRRLALALEIPAGELPAAGILEQLLEGYLLALVHRAPVEEVREAFFRYWLSYLR